MKNDLKFFKRAAVIGAIIFAFAFLDGRVTKGGLTVLLFIYSIKAAMQNQRGRALCCFILFPILQCLNPLLFPPSGIVEMAGRAAMFVLSLVMAITAARSRGRNLLPLRGIFLYLVMSAISSAQGYFPSISYFKIVNFSVFVMGVWFGTRNLQNSPKDLEFVRSFLTGLCIFLIFGSALLLPFPGYAYLNLRSAAAEAGAEYAAELYADLTAGGGIALFAGVTNQSQCLGPLLAAANMWLICDMLFILKRFERYHGALIVLGLVLMMMTHSRTSMVSFLAGILILFFYVLRRIKMAPKVRQRLVNMSYVSIALALAWMVQSEIRHGGVTKWLLKYDADAGGSMVENITHSRQGLVDQNWEDFRYNKLLGCGFQVAWYHPYLYTGKKGLILSAPIEKGVLPLMVLGEGGIVGFLSFSVFIALFYAGCIRMKLYTTLILFTVMVGSNMGEADFFSPGGIGGAKWTICVVGGFMLDSMLLHQRQEEQRQKRLAQQTA